MDKDDDNSPPHVLIFPLPVQGHVNPSLKLAELLAAAGLRITFLNSDHNQARFDRFTDVKSRFDRYPNFRFRTIPDGLPADHPDRSGGRFREWFETFMGSAKESLRRVLVSEPKPVSCMIADGLLGFAVDVGDELGVPVVHFRTVSAACFWAYFSIPDMVLAADIPLKEESDSYKNELIRSVRGMENILRRRDLPSICRFPDTSHPLVKIFEVAAQSTTRARGLILNTFEDLEPHALSLVRTRFPNTYTVGPIHALARTRLADKTTPSGSNSSLWEVDGTCTTWLDSQPSRSVIYVSFGSIATVTRDQLVEFWHGLVNSKRRFLWVLRPDSIFGGDGDGEGGGVPTELEKGTRERGYMVEWAPQEEVLAHPAVCGFLTHSGWNSTLESIVAGVPMLCWPYFADQPVNSRFVGHVWNIGLDMKDVCDRKVVEKMVNDLMVENRDDLVKSIDQMANQARETVREGGSSYSNLDRLIQDIKLMSSETDKHSRM